MLVRSRPFHRCGFASPKMRLVPAAATAFAVLLSSSLPARAEESYAVALSLDEALARAEAAAPEVSLATHAVRSAEARRVGAGVVLPVNPKLSVDARPTLEGKRAVGYAATLDLLFDVGGAPSARVDEAVRAADLARADLRVEKLRARIRAFAAYVGARLAERHIEEARASREVAERVLVATKARAQAGASGDIDESLAALDAAELVTEERDAERTREERLMDLRDALDLQPGAPLELTTTVEDPPEAPPAATLVKRALEARPELAAIRARMDLLDATDRRLAREAFPRVGVFGGVDASPLSPMFGIVGLSVELPIAQRNQGPRAIVARELDTERDRLSLEARRIARDVVATREAYETRRGELATIVSQALPAAERAVKLVEAGWKAGQFDLFRLTTATRDLVRTRARRLALLEAAWRDRIALEAAAGGAA